MKKKHLLVLACSARKKKRLGRWVPASFLYDGYAYRVLKKWLREGGEIGRLDVLILSAKYGWIWSWEKVQWYERRMGRREGEKKREEFLPEFECRLKGKRYQGVYFDLGRDYWMDGLVEAAAVVATRVERAERGIGYRQQQLKAWLHGLEVVDG